MYRGCLFFAKRRVYNKRSKLFQEASEHIYLRTEKTHRLSRYSPIFL